MNNNYEVVKYIDGEFELDVNISPKEETIWLTQKQLAELFGVNTQAISKQLQKIYNEKELSVRATCSILEQVENEGSRLIKRKIKIYNMDILIYLGFKMKSDRATQFRRWAKDTLKKYLLEGYAVNKERAIITYDNYINLVNNVLRIDNNQEEINVKLNNIETRINQYNIPLDKIFFNGEFYDAYTLIEQIFESANNEIILMDSYVDRTVLDRLTKKKQNVNVIIYTKYNASRITQDDINAVNIQYPNISLIEVTELHDRYIIIDKTKLYHVGASIKDAGRKTFSIHEVDNNLIDTLIHGVR